MHELVSYGLVNQDSYTLFRIHRPQPQFIAMKQTFELPPHDTKGYGGKAIVSLLRDWIRAIREAMIVVTPQRGP